MISLHNVSCPPADDMQKLVAVPSTRGSQKPIQYRHNCPRPLLDYAVLGKYEIIEVYRGGEAEFLAARRPRYAGSLILDCRCEIQT